MSSQTPEASTSVLPSVPLKDLEKLAGQSNFLRWRSTIQNVLRYQKVLDITKNKQENPTTGAAADALEMKNLQDSSHDIPCTSNNHHPRAPSNFNPLSYSNISKSSIVLPSPKPVLLTTPSSFLIRYISTMSNNVKNIQLAFGYPAIPYQRMRAAN
ncbi:hypothetical protein BGX38DRAFT_1200462 [Terfezia claveryi]|nr:hypothetical protein BGX38DRAFT_1200462 [Terfezia claveryi]